MNQAIKYAILLEISSGAAQRLPFTSESLEHGNVVAIVDEIHEVIWLWMGRDTGLVMRRGSMRVARSLKAYGHEIGPSIVGRKLKDVVPIDGSKIESDSNEKAKFDRVISLFTREHGIKADVLAEFQVTAELKQHAYYGLSKTQRDDLVHAAIAAPSAGDDSRKIEEIVGEFRPTVPPESSTAAVVPKPATLPKPAAVVPKPATFPKPAAVVPKPATFPKPAAVVPKPAPTIKPTPKEAILPPQIEATQTFEIPDDLPAPSIIKILEPSAELPPTSPEEELLLGEIKAAIVITSILSEYTDIFVGLKPQGGGKIFNIEGPDGLICKFSLDKSKIQFLPGSWEKIGQEQKRKIQKLFIDRVKQLIGS